MLEEKLVHTISYNMVLSQGCVMVRFLYFFFIFSLSVIVYDRGMTPHEKDFDSWNYMKKQTDIHDAHDKIRAGEIRWCRFGINVGKEIIGKGSTFHRPVLILKKFSGDVFLGIPLTTKGHTGDWYCPITVHGKDQSLILNQARVLDKKRLEEKLSEVTEAELLRIKRSYCSLILRP